MDESCVGGNLRRSCRFCALSSWLASCASRACFSRLVYAEGDRPERFYPSAEFVSEVGVFMVEREVVGK